MRNLAIVGLGFMGGSLAKVLKQKFDFIITAVDSDKSSIEAALLEGIIQAGETRIDNLQWDLFDIIILCTPIGPTIELMKQLDGKVSKSAIVIDIGSTKQEIMEVAKNLDYDFIGGHPMVGSEKFGYSYSKAHLFENAYFVLTPSDRVKQEKLNQLIKIIEEIGSIPVIMTPEQHDLITAVISHVPHVVAASLVHMAKDFESEDRFLLKLAAGGFKDITRIASSNPNLWKQITLSNKDKINSVLEKLIINLNEYKAQLNLQNEDYILNFFSAAKNTRDDLKETVNTDIPSQFSLIVDIEDKPGMIAKISTLLYENGINIKNIGIIHNREFENGCLKIIVENKQDQLLAFNILKEKTFSAFI